MINLRKYVYAIYWFYKKPINDLDIDFWENVVPSDLEEVK